jgi:S1-C subfamily serine protease
VLHFFTGAHADYHKPSDIVQSLNVAGIAQVAEVVRGVTLAIGELSGGLSYQKLPAPMPRGDMRSFNASLGSVPDYAGPPGGQAGMLLAGVRAGGAAARGGLQRGDILVKLSKHAIGNVRDLMYALMALKPGQTVTAVIVRDGKRLPLQVTLQQSKPRRHR